MKRRVILLLFLLFFSSSVFALTNTNKTNSTPLSEKTLNKLIHLHRDPFAASIYSLIYAGGGQFYNHDYTKGSLLFLGETIYHIFNFGIKYKLHNTYGDQVSFSQLQSGDQILLISAFIAFVTLKSYSIYDANVNARIFNQKIDRRLLHFRLEINKESARGVFQLRF